MKPAAHAIEYENLARVNARFAGELRAAWERVLARGQFVLGPEVEAFERAFAATVGTRECVGVASGLDALALALRALDLPAGSEAIVPANTYKATILSVMHAGLVPVGVEPDPATMNLDPERLEAALTPRTRVVCPVHLYGRPCPMEPIGAFAARHGLLVVEDCAQAHGARYRGRPVGAFGAAAAWSFYPTKVLGALGDAGAVTTDDAALAQRLRELRNYGGRHRDSSARVGVNSRLDEIQAAMLLAKLPHLDELVSHRRRLAQVYREELPRSVTAPARDADVFEVHAMFAARHPRRDALRGHLAARGIGTQVHYPVPPHRQPAFADVLRGPFPIADGIHATELSLPISYFHSPDDVVAVCRAIAEFDRIAQVRP